MAGKKKIYDLPYLKVPKRTDLIPLSKGFDEEDTVHTQIGDIIDNLIAGELNIIPTYMNPNYPFAEQLAFINAQRKAIKPADVLGYGVNMNQEYAFDFDGMFSGEVFLPAGFTSRTNDISVFLPNGVATYLDLNSYTGSFNGNVSYDLVNIALYEMRIYKIVDDLETAVGVATFQSNGNWTFNGTTTTGVYMFRMFKISTNDEVANYFNDGSDQSLYNDLRLEVYNINSTSTKIKTIPVTLSNKFYISSTTDGYKTAKLIRISTSTTVAESSYSVDLPRSFRYNETDPETANGENKRTYLQDAAYTLLVAVKLSDFDLADKIVRGLTKSQFSNGSFPLFVKHDFPDDPANVTTIRSVTMGWVTYALCVYLRQTPESGDLQSTAKNSLMIALQYVNQNLRNNTGVLSDAVRTGKNAAVDIPNFEVIGNMLAYFSYFHASIVLGLYSFKVISDEIKNVLNTLYFNKTTKRFLYSINEDGTVVSRDTLELNVMSVHYLIAIRQKSLTTIHLKRCEDYFRYTDVDLSTTGFTPYNTSLGFTAVPEVWFEGNFLVGHSYALYGSQPAFLSIMLDTYGFLQSDGSFRQGGKREDLLVVNTKKALGSTCWFVLAGAHGKSTLTITDADIASLPKQTDGIGVPRTQKFSYTGGAQAFVLEKDAKFVYSVFVRGQALNTVTDVTKAGNVVTIPLPTVWDADGQPINGNTLEVGDEILITYLHSGGDSNQQGLPYTESFTYASGLQKFLLAQEPSFIYSVTVRGQGINPISDIDVVDKEISIHPPTAWAIDSTTQEADPNQPLNGNTLQNGDEVVVTYLVGGYGSFAGVINDLITSLQQTWSSAKILSELSKSGKTTLNKNQNDLVLDTESGMYYLPLPDSSFVGKVPVLMLVNGNKTDYGYKDTVVPPRITGFANNTESQTIIIHGI